MRKRLAAIAICFACIAAGIAPGFAQNCPVSHELVATFAPLPRVHADVTKNRKLNILVVSAAPTQTGAAAGLKSYPYFLELALKARLKKTDVTVFAHSIPRKPIDDMVAALPQLLTEQKPDLVIWQTGTVEAIRAMDPDVYGDKLLAGVELILAAKSDVILMNQQYSPRTDYMFDGAPYTDNMRYVAVTEGDKVEAELKFGYSVNTYGVGDLVKVIDSISDDEVNALIAEYENTYTMAADLKKGGAKHQSVYDAAKIELGLKKFLEDGGFKGFTDTFEDLHGMIQLPGIAAQRLMAAGYGFAGEGDWKTAALVRAFKVMGSGLKGGNAFMEDYTYHFDPNNELVLGSHMLEIDASLANGKAALEVHPLGIGGKADPARLVFNVAGGPALNASIVDMGNRFRLLINEVEAVEPQNDLPNLPVARVLWKPYPDMKTGCAAWIYAGGAHHTAYSQNLTAEHLQDFADMAGLEFIRIGKDTKLDQLRNELRWNDASYK